MAYAEKVEPEMVEKSEQSTRKGADLSPIEELNTAIAQATGDSTEEAVNPPSGDPLTAAMLAPQLESGTASEFSIADATNLEPELPAIAWMRSKPNTEAAASTNSKWTILTAKARVDSFNQSELIRELGELEKSQKYIAIDLRQNRFLSIPAIRFCVNMAVQLQNEGGQLALIGCTEKTKRHFEIYGSLAHLQLYRSETHLPN